MTKEFVPYELAVKLKELGFDEPCFMYWYKANNGYVLVDEKTQTFQQYVLAPLYQQAFRWFREKYKRHYPIAVSDGVWFYDKWSLGVYKTYEEAELACLNKLIEIVETKR